MVFGGTHLAANRRGIGLVFQSYALFPHLDVVGNVGFGLRIRRVPAAEMAARSAAALARVGLTGLEQRMPKTLSGGQQQRVALARALVVEPHLLLLDEPLSNLDARLRLEMRGELRRLQSELGVTMLYVTHDQAEALALADRIVVMRAGSIEQIGDPETIHDRPQTGFVARFMGFENIVPVENGRLVLSGIADGPQTPFPGARALAWSPGAVLLGQGPFQASIVTAAFAGGHIDYLLDSPIGKIKAESPASAPRYTAGEQICFDLPFAQAAPLAAA